MANYDQDNRDIMYRIIGELYHSRVLYQESTSELYQQIDDLKHERSELLSRIAGLEADIAGMSPPNPLSYAYACEYCDYETDEALELGAHTYREHDACDPHGIERIAVPEVW